MPRRPMFPCLLCALAVACHSAPSALAARPDTNGSTADGAFVTPASSSTIDAAELQRTGASNLYDAINQLRPGFFPSRGRTSVLNQSDDEILVVLDRQVLGGVSELRNIATKITRSVRRLSAADVFQITGRMASSGGIEVVLGR